MLSSELDSCCCCLTVMSSVIVSLTGNKHDAPSGNWLQYIRQNNNVRLLGIRFWRKHDTRQVQAQLLKYNFLLQIFLAERWIEFETQSVHSPAWEMGTFFIFQLAESPNIYLCSGVCALLDEGASDLLGFHLFLPVLSYGISQEKQEHSKFCFKNPKFHPGKFVIWPLNRGMCDLFSFKLCRRLFLHENTIHF